MYFLLLFRLVFVLSVVVFCCFVLIDVRARAPAPLLCFIASKPQSLLRPNTKHLDVTLTRNVWSHIFRSVKAKNRFQNTCLEPESQYEAKAVNKKRKGGVLKNMLWRWLYINCPFLFRKRWTLNLWTIFRVGQMPESVAVSIGGFQVAVQAPEVMIEFNNIVSDAPRPGGLVLSPLVCGSCIASRLRRRLPVLLTAFSGVPWSR